MLNKTSSITVKTLINQSIELTWEAFNSPQHMQKWAKSSPEWIVKVAESDLKIGGKIKVILMTHDHSIFLQYGGTYEKIDFNKHINILLEDGRSLDITFSSLHDMTDVQLVIDSIEEQPIDVQENGWQSLLDNLKSYAESITELLKKQDNFIE